MNLINLFRRRELWQIAIYKLTNTSEIFHLESTKPFFIFGEKRLRLDLEYQSTIADPFLFIHKDILYLFYEVKTDHDHGEIWASRLSHDGAWCSLGCVLSEAFHLSYPQVFESDGEIYMIPEAAHSGKVLLYHASDFPTKWSVLSMIRNEGLLDPTIYQASEGNFYLFGTTRKNELKLYYSESIFNLFLDTGIVITSDKLSSRCAGGIVTINGVKYRPAQDCRDIYGKRVHMHKINELTPNSYSETLISPELLVNVPSWASEGYHHISAVSIDECAFIAIDGRNKDRYINTLTYSVLKLYEVIRRVFKMS